MKKPLKNRLDYKKKFHSYYETPFGSLTKEKAIEDPREASVEYYSPEIHTNEVTNTFSPFSTYTDSGFNFSNDYPLSVSFPRKWFDIDTAYIVECGVKKVAYANPYPEFDITGGSWEVEDIGGKKVVKRTNPKKRIPKEKYYYIDNWNKVHPVYIKKNLKNNVVIATDINTETDFTVNKDELLDLPSYIALLRSNY